MPKPKIIIEEISLSEHQRRLAKARWAKTTPAERSAYARKMVAAREAKRSAARAFDGLHGDITLICTVCSKRHYPRCKAGRNKP